MGKHDYTKGPLETGPRRPFVEHSGSVTDIVVHYLWTLPSSDFSMRDVAKIHTKDNGWNGPGYHYLIRVDGSVEYGRPEWARGAHVLGHNDRKIGIAYEGGRIPGDDHSGHNTMNVEQGHSLTKLINDIRRRHKSIKRIRGHKDYVPTQCPGFDVQEWWDGKNSRTSTDPSDPAIVNPSPLEESRARGFLAWLGSFFGWDRSNG